jgi:hypothetical protein
MRRCAIVTLFSGMLTASTAMADIVPIGDHGFESGPAELANPLLDPPLSGTIGGWHVERSALGQITGLLVPRIGIVETDAATEGDHVGRILFIAGVVSQASFSQELGVGLSPATRYTLSVDVGAAGLADVMAEATVRVYAGPTLVATSDDAAFLTILDLGGDVDRFVLQFCGGAAPAAGELRVELVGESVVSVASAVAFDNVQLSAEAFNCSCNINGDCVLNSQDFFDFLTLFFTQDPRSDYNGDGLFNSQDYFDFLTCFFGDVVECR